MIKNFRVTLILKKIVPAMVSDSANIFRFIRPVHAVSVSVTLPVKVDTVVGGLALDLVLTTVSVAVLQGALTILHKQT